MWMYRALTDAGEAQKMWEARPPSFKPEAGNSLAQTYVWITALGDLGEVDRTVTSDTPFAATFVRAGKRKHVVWNLSDKDKTVSFSDGAQVLCPPHGTLTR